MDTAITFNANDNTSSAISGIIAGLTGMDAIGATAFQGLIGVTTNLTQKITGFAWEVTQLGATAEAMQGKFDMVFRSLGGGVTQELVEFGQAAGRSKYELMRMAAEFQDTLVPMGFARDEAAEMSVGLTKLAVDLASFNDISDEDAFRRLQGGLIGNTENLLKFGVIANVAQLEQFALNAELWDGVGVLDPLTKATAIYQMTIAQTADAQNDAILTAWQFNNTMKALEAVFSELKTEMGSRLVPEFGNFLNIFKAFIPGVQQVGAGLAGVFANLMSTVSRFASGFIQSFTGLNFNQITKDSKTWGNDLIVNFARGMAEAVKYIVQVLQYIGDVITYWLVPHSPPKILPDIDKWGADTMMEYIKGFGQADLSLFDSIASQVSSYIKQAMPDDDELDKLDISNQITLSRQVIAENIKIINDYKDTYFEAMIQNSEMSKYLVGNIQDLSYWSNKMLVDYQSGVIGSIAPTEEWQAQVELAIENISSSAGGLSPAFEEYLQVLFNSEYATSQVALAQEELNQVTQHFSELLAPLNKELAQINDAKEAIRTQQRLEQLQSVLSDETKSAQEKELAALEIRGIEIEKQIKEVEKEQELSTTIAEQKLSAAQLQQQKFEEELKIKQQILGIGQEQNNLFKEQGDLMDSIAEKMDKLGDAMGKAAKGLGDGAKDIKEAMTDMTDWGDAPPALSVFEETFSTIDDIFAELQPASEKLGNTWGLIGQTIAENVVVRGFKFLYTTVIDLKTEFDELVRKVSIFETLMTSDSVVQRLRNIGVEVGQIFNSLFNGDKGDVFASLGESLPTIKQNLFAFMDDFGRNFKAVFGTDISKEIDSTKEVLGTMFDNFIPSLEQVDSVATKIKDWFGEQLADNQPVLDSISASFDKLYEIFNRSGWKILSATLEQLGSVIKVIAGILFSLFWGVIEAGLVVLDKLFKAFVLVAEYAEKSAANFTKFKELVKSLSSAFADGDWGKINEVLGAMWEVVLSNVDNLFGMLGGLVKLAVLAVLEGVITLFAGVIDTAVQLLTGMDTDTIFAQWAVNIELFIGILARLIEIGIEGWLDFVNFLTETFMNGIAILDAIAAQWKENLRMAIVIVQAYWEGFKAYNLALIAWLGVKFTEWKDYFILIFQTATETILGKVTQAWESFKITLQEWIDWFIEMFWLAIDTVTLWGDNILTYINDIVIAVNGSLKVALDTLKEKFELVTGAIKLAWESMKNTLIGLYDTYIKPKILEMRDEFLNLWTDLKQYFYDISMWIIGMKDNFIIAVNAILEKIAPLLEAMGLLNGAGEGSTGGGQNPRANNSARGQSGMDLNTQSLRDTLPPVKNAFAENDIRELVSRDTNQVWNITFNQQNVEKRNALEDMQLVKTFMGS